MLIRTENIYFDYQQELFEEVYNLHCRGYLIQATLKAIILRIRLILILSIYRLLRSTGIVANHSHFTPARVAKSKRLSKTSDPYGRGSIDLFRFYTESYGKYLHLET